MAEDALCKDAQRSQSPTEHASSLQAEIERQQDEIRRLQAEIRALRGSLSWKVTYPLRILARCLPGLAGWTQRNLDRAKDALVRHLPAQAVQAFIKTPWEVRADIGEQIAAYRAARSKSARRIVVYTAIFGKYDNLLLPERLDPEVDYVCFTDRPRNDYGVWQMRAAPYYHSDPTRVARWVKTHPHELFEDHDVAVWIDANIILKGDIRHYIEKARNEGAHLGLISHPHRQCFYEEAEACKRLKKDAGKAIDLQVEHYRKNGLPLNLPLYETGFMVVPLKKPESAEALHLWWQQIERFSRRDQLGLAWVIYRFPELKIVSLLPQGSSVRDHEDFVYFRHSFAQALIVPEALLKLGTVADPLEGPTFDEVKDRRLEMLKDRPIDIIVCVHNALEDVRLCLSSVWESRLPAHRVIIINDRSNDETSAYLRSFAADKDWVKLIENEENMGYTRSASLGLASGTAEFRILLNSDTIVSPNWALKLLDVAEQGDRIGIVGALSNAAGAQSIPYIKSKGNNTAINDLPKNLRATDIDLACERWSLANCFPSVPLVHGFCFGVKKKVVDQIGLFDDENFKQFYGEENDYCFRALAAGFELALATNTFVFHRKSRSIDEEKRVVHMAEAWKRLREIYGADRILAAYAQVEGHPLLERIRNKAKPYFASSSAEGA